MNIIIAGDGEVGVHLAKSLSELDYNITVVDPHAEQLGKREMSQLVGRDNKTEKDDRKQDRPDLAPDRPDADG